MTLSLDEESIAYFKSIASDMGRPYEALIYFNLRDCAPIHRKPNLNSE